MATDILLVLQNLTHFYDFRDKTVVHVGAGGGQFVGYATKARHVVAVDPDATAVAQLRTAIVALRLADRFTVKQSDFESVLDRADLVLFEFCLHEMPDPEAALNHARTLAPEILVIDHAPDSRWAWHTAETEKATRSWAAVDSMGVRRTENYSGLQHFGDGDALLQRIKELGEPAVARAKTLSHAKAIEIPMTYRIAVI